MGQGLRRLGVRLTEGLCLRAVCHRWPVREQAGFVFLGSFRFFRWLCHVAHGRFVLSTFGEGRLEARGPGNAGELSRGLSVNTLTVAVYDGSPGEGALRV